ncbi:ferredoxin--NADP reductase [Pontibacter fetidus]|uniref:Ferredoxin--NADP reductase n=1 Tax=Pontibacter fetidus TaxID=2700082 RepID=A0A6B2H184_9BACT|nr:ferredoxin--NADP reductase [Pontibacter fetidus]NDK55898.1 ferredoxin--NADP reductase [Pontibacter fetidus]
MSNSYHTLKIADITRETSDAVTLHFEQPQNQTINYKPGQFLTLIIPFEGKKERRSYSLSSTPHENNLSVTIKRVPGGKVSNYLLDNATVGQEIEVMEPLGNFCITCDAAETRNVILLGAGSGITPLMSILKGVLREEPNSKVTLLYGNRDENSVIFKDQLEQLRANNPDRLQIAYIYSQPKQDCEYRGRMNQSLIIKILERLQLSKISNGLYFMCGPEGMMDEVKKALHVLHVPAERVFRESFVSTKLAGEPDSDGHGDVSATDQDEIVTQTVTIIYEGSEYSVTVNPDQTILEAALDQDVDLPYSCQAGLCTACRGKCLSGKVHLDEREGLSDAELDEGYVLNCVGHPLTSDVVIEIG